nr:hypothetical protein CFP56_13877 [Quercus suber]
MELSPTSSNLLQIVSPTWLREGVKARSRRTTFLQFSPSQRPNITSERALPKNMACCLITLSTESALRVNLNLATEEVCSSRKDIRTGPSYEVLNFGRAV